MRPFFDFLLSCSLLIIFSNCFSQVRARKGFGQLSIGFNGRVKSSSSSWIFLISCVLLIETWGSSRISSLLLNSIFRISLIEKVFSCSMFSIELGSSNLAVISVIWSGLCGLQIKIFWGAMHRVCCASGSCFQICRNFCKAVFVVGDNVKFSMLSLFRKIFCF